MQFCNRIAKLHKILLCYIDKNRVQHKNQVK